MKKMKIAFPNGMEVIGTLQEKEEPELSESLWNFAENGASLSVTTHYPQDMLMEHIPGLPEAQLRLVLWGGQWGMIRYPILKFRQGKSFGLEIVCLYPMDHVQSRELLEP